MSLWWIFVNPKGQWPEAASGPSMGQASFCTEGDSMLSLSGTLFSSIIAGEYPSEQCTIKYILADFGLIWQNNEHLEFRILYPNTTLWVKYNII